MEVFLILYKIETIDHLDLEIEDGGSWLAFRKSDSFYLNCCNCNKEYIRDDIISLLVLKDSEKRILHICEECAQKYINEGVRFQSKSSILKKEAKIIKDKQENLLYMLKLSKKEQEDVEIFLNLRGIKFSK